MKWVNNTRECIQHQADLGRAISPTTKLQKKIMSIALQQEIEELLVSEVVFCPFVP